MTQKLGLKFITEKQDGVVWFRIEGLDNSDLIEMLKSDKENRAKTLIGALEKHTGDAQLCLSEALAREMGLIDKRIVPEFNLEAVERNVFFSAINGRIKGFLPVADGKTVARFSRNSGNPMAEDRFLALSTYHDRRCGEDLICSRYFMLEIDDPELESAYRDFGESILPGFAKDHILAATDACKVIARDLVSPPFCAVFSGKKSFHMIWQYDQPLMPTDREICREAFLHRANRAKAGTDPVAQAINRIDHQTPFSSTVLARLPCEYVEPGRGRQVAFKTGCRGVLSTARLIDTAREIISARDQTELLNRMERIEWNRFGGDEKLDGPLPPEVIESALGAGVKPRHGGGYLCKCPIHQDSHASAFCSATGFIYCSVCCTENAWIAKVKRDGTIMRNERA